MPEVKCSSCGHTGEADNKWLKCPECGHTLCHRCGDQARKEKKDLETLRVGSSYDRIRVTCPSCTHYLTPF